MKPLKLGWYKITTDMRHTTHKFLIRITKDILKNHFSKDEYMCDRIYEEVHGGDCSCHIHTRYLGKNKPKRKMHELRFMPVTQIKLQVISKEDKEDEDK